MIVITFKDGVSVNLHEDNSIEVVEFNMTDDIELVRNVVEGNDDIVFDIINKRLGGCL